MYREDYPALKALGFEDDEIKALNLWEPATGDPASLAEAYIRRSAKREDMVTLRSHVRDVVRLAERQNVSIRRVWFEQHSASKRYATRQEFDKATGAIMAGVSKAFLVWKLDRFDRRGMGVVGTMMDDFANRKARLCTWADGIDSSQKGSRTIIAILSERAREEAEDIALRVTQGHDAHKEIGRRGTGRPPFGLYSAPKSGKVEPHPEEFPVARLLADLLLGQPNPLLQETAKEAAAREPMATRVVSATLNEMGYRTRSGKTWSATAVSKLAQSPLFAGMTPNRERHVDEHGNALGTWKGYGDPLYDAKGRPVICGKGVITPAEWFRVKQLISERTNPFAGVGRRKATYLLTRILRCGRCGGHMSGGGGKYHCSTRQQRGASVCTGVSTVAGRVDDAVSGAWVGHVSTLGPEDAALYEIGRRWRVFSDPEAAAKQENTRAALEAAEARLQSLDDAYYNPVGAPMSEARYTRQADALATTIESLSAELAVIEKESDAIPSVDPEYLREAWEQSNFDTKRFLLACVFTSITVTPATGRGDQRPIHERLVFKGV